MKRRLVFGTLSCLVSTLALLAAQGPAPATQTSTAAPTSTESRDWRTYGGDLASTRYAPLDQINASNFDKLQVAWRFRTDSLGPRPETNFETTPLMVGGVIYSTVGTRRAVVALDAGTG